MQKNIISPLDNVVDFIPQRSPIVMVDELFEADASGQSAITGFTILKDDIFVSENKFSISGIIEHMAQSCALKSGFESSQLDGQNSPAVGYIGAVKNFELFRLPNVGEQLTTTLRVITQIQQVSVVEVFTVINKKIIASANLHIFQLAN